MAFPITKSKAQQVRDEYRAKQIKRLSETKQQQTLNPPGFPSNPIVDPVDGTLDTTALKADLPVQMGAWEALPPSGLTSVPELQWTRGVDADPENDAAYTKVDSVQVIGPVTDPTAVFPLNLKVPKSELATDGRHYLRLALPHFATGIYIYSTPIALICDSEGPYVHDVPPEMIVPPVPITDQYFIDNGPEVVGEIPEYDDYAPGDKVAFFWAKFPPPDDPTDVVPIDTVEVDGVTWPFKVHYPEAVIRAASDGIHYPLYVLIDKANNLSKLSVYVPVHVALGALPSGLKVPEVPLAADGLLDLKDANSITGIEVLIQAFDNYKDTDSIDVTWGTTPLQGSPVGSGGFPKVVRIPAEILKSTFGTATGPVDTTVSYVVSRGGLASAPQSTTVKVDFSIIGPPRPDPDPTWPDPVNPALALVDVHGAVSPTPNILTRADADQPVGVELTLYGPLVAGQIIDFYWTGILSPTTQYTVLATDQPGDTITREIPWAIIEQGYNNPKLPVHYRIRASATAENEQHSPNREVNADAVTLKAPAATFEGLSGPGFLVCESLYADPVLIHPLEPAVRVKVADLSGAPFNLVAGAKVTMNWVLLDYDTDAPLGGADLTEEITLGTDYPPAGFVWRVQPYDTKLLPSYNTPSRLGKGRITYSFKIGAGPTEETITSELEEKPVSMTPGNGSCELRPLP